MNAVTPDVYAAWLTAGNNLQPVGRWLAGGGAWIPILAVAAVLIWRIRQAARRVDQILGEPAKRETKPGSNRRDLQTCNDILAATDKQTRKEDQS